MNLDELVKDMEECVAERVEDKLAAAVERTLAGYVVGQLVELKSTGQRGRIVQVHPMEGRVWVRLHNRTVVGPSMPIDHVRVVAPSQEEPDPYGLPDR